MLNLRLLYITLLLTCFKVFGQELSISTISINEGMASMIARIEQGHSPRERYNLFLYSSADNFTRPLTYKPTDLAPNVDHKLSFDAGQVIGSYEGDLQFRFEIEASKFPVFLINPKSKYRRGKSIFLQWNDYHEAGPYQVELWRNDELVEILAENISSKSHTVVLSKNLEKGKNYQLKIRALSGEGLDSEGYPIAIQSKYGMGVKILPILAAGGAIPIIMGASAQGGGESPLADPPGPPSGN